MKIEFSAEAWEDFEYWSVHDKKILKKINALLEDIMRDPHKGMGKPEPLKYDLAGFWSRRISREHRLVYKVQKGTLYILQCRYHY
jgi:toxin YoeB